MFDASNLLIGSVLQQLTPFEQRFDRVDAPDALLLRPLAVSAATTRQLQDLQNIKRWAYLFMHS